MLARLGISIWIILVAAPGLIAIGVILLQNHPYYLAPLAEQALHNLHPWLRSSGKLGLTFGLAGTVLMILNLLYLVRRRAVTWTWAGSLRGWMNFHVTTGLLSGGLILLHSCLSYRSAPGGIAATAIAIVILTGVIGRYIYSRVPRSLEGRELRIDEVRENLEYLRLQLERLGISLPAVARMGHFEGEDGTPGQRSMLGSLWIAVFGDREARRRLRQAQHELMRQTIPMEVSHEANKLLRRMFRETTWLERYHGLRSLMSSWRFLHLWLAVLMIAAAVTHIALAVIYGDLWILGGLFG